MIGRCTITGGMTREDSTTGKFRIEGRMAITITISKSRKEVIN